MENRISAKILVVDDEPDIRALLKLLLEGRGYQVGQEGSGAAAVARLQAEAGFDLIIMDIMMPEMDGVAACKALREFSRAPVLFLTAKTQLGDKVEAYESGGDDFLAKPFAPNELLAKVEALLRRYRVYRGKQEADSMGEITLDEATRCVTRSGSGWN